MSREFLVVVSDLESVGLAQGLWVDALGSQAFESLEARQAFEIKLESRI